MSDLDSAFDLISSPMRVLEKLGLPGAIASLVLGIGLSVTGVVLAFGLLDDGGYYWPAMLGLSGLGLCFAGLGLSYFVGPQRAVRRAMGYQPERIDPRAMNEIQRELPFWVCASCRIARDGVSTADRCMECGSVADYFEAHDETGRRTALAMLTRS